MRGDMIGLTRRVVEKNKRLGGDRWGGGSRREEYLVAVTGDNDHLYNGSWITTSKMVNNDMV